MKDKKRLFRDLLLSWFRHNKRPLPWRDSRDPYIIWLSEIILQQTRVAQGEPYFLRFVERFPNIEAFAAATEQEVLRLWQGLGYYSRARNMHHTAKAVVENYEGKFPAGYGELKKLKGIGDYTAAAITSIAHNSPHAVLDGNVYRVLARLLNVYTPINIQAGKKEFQALADTWLDPAQPGAYNEALMELGATICLPRNPLCPQCPVHSCCQAFARGNAHELPVKMAARKTVTRHLHYLLILKEAGLYLRRRGAGDIWQGLYDLPLVESNADKAPTVEDWQNVTGIKGPKVEKKYETRHLLTHQKLMISFYQTDLPMQGIIRQEGIIFAEFKQLDNFPLPRPVEIFLKEYWPAGAK